MSKAHKWVVEHRDEKKIIWRCSVCDERYAEIFGVGEFIPSSGCVVRHKRPTITLKKKK
jgi:hypothetical protein